MRIAYATTFDARKVHHWSGTPFHMAKAFSEAGTDIHYIGDLTRKLPRFFKIKQIYQKFINHQRLSPRFNEVAAKAYSAQVAARLMKINADVVLSPLINPVAYLDCKKPIVLWTDAVYASLIGFYPAFAYHSADTIQQANQVTFSCLSRASLIIFSSEWAAQSAIQLYGIRKQKIYVVPYGANIDSYPSRENLFDIISKRPNDKVRLLFLAKSWERKGGDIALAVAKGLHEAGINVELNIVGYTPSLQFPSYVRCLGFISKKTIEGKNKLKELLINSHFLILPARADACPMVFAEANAHALPCLTTHVGGISTAIKNDVNGKTFGLDEPIDHYVKYILEIMQNKKRYEELAHSSYHEYETRLNWNTSVSTVIQLMKQL